TVTDKVYDGGTTANLNKSSATLVGLISGDVVSLSATNASGTYVSANAANGITVSVTGNTISGTDSANYTLSQPTLTGNITPALITITGANNTLTYNASIQTNSGAKVSINGGIATTISGSTINTGIGTESFTLTGYAAAKDYSATRYNDSLLLTSGTGTVAGNYSITYSQGGLTINKAPLTVTGVTTSVTYNGGAQTNNAATITGKQGSDSIVVAGYASATNVGNYSDNLSVTSSVASNYNITYVNGSLTINTKALTIVANAQSTPYGTVVTTGAGATQFTTVGLVSSDVVNSVTLSTNQLVTTNAGASGIIATPSAALGSGLSNYSITYNTGVVTVTPKALTITANAQSTTYGTGLTLGTSGYTVSGLINSDWYL
ncbi:MAG: hypothetical protein EBV74_05760, partial [Alphaproteobacteria bacterium]|nr:hypothetical protein [Candidatus Fonsibacter sp. PEL55]